MTSTFNKPFLSLVPGDERNICFLCREALRKQEKSQTIKEPGWESLKTMALHWKDVTNPRTYASNFPLVHCNLAEDFSQQKEQLKCHTKCRQMFQDKNKLEANLRDSLPLTTEEPMSIDDSQSQQDSLPENTVATRSKVSHLPLPGDRKRKCFLCDKSRKKTRGKEESLMKLEEPRAEATILGVMEENELSNDPILQNAAKRLRLHSAAGDLLARELEYHRSCYLYFTVRPVKKNENECSLDMVNGKAAEKEFLRITEKKIVSEKCCFFLTDLLEDMQTLYDEHMVPLTYRKTYTSQIKELIFSKFGDKVGFTRAAGVHGSGNIIHSASVNPLDYSLATIRGAGLRDNEIIKAFAKMINRKIKYRAEANIAPESSMFSFDEIIQGLEKHEPMPELYNVIAMSLNPSCKVNEYGFAAISPLQARKVWSIADIWQELLTRRTSPSSLALGMVIHRVTGSKEVINILSKAGMTPTYTKIMETSKKWANDTTAELNRRVAPPLLQPFKPTHVTLDNNDGRQMTSTGVGTTHDTTGTINQPTLPGEEVIATFQEGGSQDLEDYGETADVDYGEYKIGKPKAPPMIKEYTPSTDKSELTDRFNKDCAWVLAAAVNKQSLTVDSVDVEENLAQTDQEINTYLGSWTAFNKNVTSVETTQSRCEYLPTIPHAPDDRICKYYLDYIIDLADSLQLHHIFVHCDQAVFSKMSQIIWKESGKYDKVKCIMGGFHILLCWLKVLYKQYGALGFREWWCQSNVIAQGSVDQALEGRHYSRSLRLHKQSFEAFIRFKVSEMVTSPNLQEKLKNLHSDVSEVALKNVISDADFYLAKFEVLRSEGTMGKLIVKYIKDVSCMLSFIASFREKNMELHLQALQELIPLLFAFNHHNYSRYLTHSHIVLSNMKEEDPDAYDDLSIYGPGISLSGERFSSIPGDLVTEVGPNRESKIRGGPMRGGYSTSPEAVDTFYKNSHKLAKLRKKVKDQFLVKTSTTHSETTTGAKAKHEKQVTAMVEKLRTYPNPFSGPARLISSGIELQPVIVEGLLQARSIGEEMHQAFYSDRLISSNVDFFEPVKKSGIKTGLEKKKKTGKVLSVLKEDRQALGIIVEKCHNKRDAFSHCLTTYPLAIATTDGKLYQPGSKAKFRNYILQEADASIMSPPLQATWIYDAMATIRASKPAKTWGDYMANQLRSFTPASALNAVESIVVFDNYIDDQEFSIKQATRIERGTSARVHMGTNDQDMIQGKDFQSFMHNNDNKDELIERFVDYVQQQQTRNHMRIQYTVNHGFYTVKVSNTNIEELGDCNHEEADTRIVLHAFQCEGPVVVKAKDTDVFILMVYAYALKQPNFDWCIQIDNDKFISVRKIVTFLGRETSIYLPAFHVITGCDTTSYFYHTSKKCIFEKARKGNHLHLLDKLGTARTLDAEDQHDVTSFIKNVIYNGKSDEDLVSLRIRQYDRLRLKTTQTIIPDPDSIAYAVKRANMAAYYLKNFGTRIVQKINPCDSGWYCKDGVLNPRWYDGPQMPPSATARQNRPNSQHITDVETSGSDADREESNNDFDDHDDNASEVEFWEKLFEDFSSESDEYDSDDPEYLP